MKRKKGPDDPGQMNLFNREASTEARDAAIEQVEEHADDDWKYSAEQAAFRTCVKYPDFVIDQVWKEFEMTNGEFAYTGTHEKRAMGAVMNNAHRAGWCEPSKTYRASDIVRNHRNPRVIWKSRLWKAPSSPELQ